MGHVINTTITTVGDWVGVLNDVLTNMPEFNLEGIDPTLAPYFKGLTDAIINAVMNEIDAMVLILATREIAACQSQLLKCLTTKNGLRAEATIQPPEIFQEGPHAAMAPRDLKEEVALTSRTYNGTIPCIEVTLSTRPVKNHIVHCIMWPTDASGNMHKTQTH